MEEVEYGYCHCGCGQKTNLAQQTSTKYGWIKGEPLKFILGHALKGTSGQNRKEIIISTHGYETTFCPRHPKAHKGYVYTHILIAESVLGKSLPPRAVVHHVDGDKQEYQGNMVICEDESYHQLLHQRERALRACGHASWRKCKSCGTYDSLSAMRKTGRSNCHIDKMECRKRRLEHEG